MSTLKKWANPGLFLFIFGLFKQTSLQFLQQIHVKKCPSSIRCLDSNPQPSDRETPPITTRRGSRRNFMPTLQWQEFRCVYFLQQIRTCEELTHNYPDPHGLPKRQYQKFPAIFLSMVFTPRFSFYSRSFQTKFTEKLLQALAGFELGSSKQKASTLTTRLHTITTQVSLNF